MEREDGVYWIRQDGRTDWQIAEYLGKGWGWTFPGDDVVYADGDTAAMFFITVTDERGPIPKPEDD